MAARPKKLSAARAVTAESVAPPPEAAAATRAPVPTGTAVRLNGSLDRVDPDGTIEGWCWSPDEPDVQRPLAVLVDGVEAARLVSDQERADLVSAGVGNGRHAFLQRLDPAAIRPGQRATVVLRDMRSGLQIGGSVEVQWPGAAVQLAAVQAAPEPPRLLHGNLDRVSRDGWISGWCWYPDFPGEHVELTVLVDDEPVGTTRAANFRQDLQHAGIGDGSHGFSFALPYAALADKGTLRVSVQDSRSGRAISDPINVRLGRMAAAEDRIQDLERQIRLLRGHIEDLTRVAEARDEDRATRELFTTVAAFFADLAKGGLGRGEGGNAREFGAAGLAGALEQVASRYAAITLALPADPVATICVAATAGFDAIYRCLAALQAAGIDRQADIVVLDDGKQGGYGALLPSVVRNLRYVHLRDDATLVAGRNEVARNSRGALMAFLAPETRVTTGWLDEIVATFAREPDAAVVAGRLVREDGLLQHSFLLASEDGRLRDPGHLASAERPEHRFLRRADAVAGVGFAVRRDLLLASGFSELYRRFGHAVADLCARLRAQGHPVLYQPVATALWVERGPSSGDGDPPDLSLPDEETLRLRQRVQHEGWPAGPASARFTGHALVIDDDLPRPDRDAGSIATFEQMLLLRRLGWHVTFCPVHALTLDPTEADRLARQGIEVAGPPHFGSVTQYLQAEGVGLDLVHVYRYSNAAMLLDRVRELAPAARVVFATADLHFLREQRRAELTGQPFSDAARAEELRCMHAADATIVTSDHEMTVLAGEINPAKLVLLRWITRPVPRDTGVRGAAGHLLRRQFPPSAQSGRHPVVPGRSAAADPRRAARAAAAAGRQRDAARHQRYERRGRRGAGLGRGSRRVVRRGAAVGGAAAVRRRVSRARSRPASPTGCRWSVPRFRWKAPGLQDGDGVAVADSPAEFARAIVRLHENAALWEAQSARALERVAALYSPDAALDVWRQLLAGLELPTEP